MGHATVPISFPWLARRVRRWSWIFGAPPDSGCASENDPLTSRPVALLLASWTILALWDLARRDDVSTARGVVWALVVLVVPFLGAIAYHLIGGSKLPVWLRWAVIAGGALAYLVTFFAISIVGGVL